MRSEYIAQLVCSFQGQWFDQRVAGFFRRRATSRFRRSLPFCARGPWSCVMSSCFDTTLPCARMRQFNSANSCVVRCNTVPCGDCSCQSCVARVQKTLRALGQAFGRVIRMQRQPLPHSINVGCQFKQADRLDQISVCTRTQTQQSVAQRIPRTQNNDCHLRLVFQQLRYGQTTLTRQTDVQNNHIHRAGHELPVEGLCTACAPTPDSRRPARTLRWSATDRHHPQQWQCGVWGVFMGRQFRPLAGNAGECSVRSGSLPARAVTRVRCLRAG